MADAILSVVVADAAEQIRKEVNLVRSVDREILNLSNELETIRNVLDDADRRGLKEKRVEGWLKSLEETSYEMSGVLDEWNIALLRLGMEQSVDNVVPPKNKPTHPLGGSWRVQSTSLIDVEEVYDRDFERDNLVCKLVAQEVGIQVLSIVGVGGLGKTTLAQRAYNDSRVKNCFELRIWICVSDPFDEFKIAKGIVECVKKGSSPDTDQLELVLECLRVSISGKKFLLVLDDVWSQDDTKWEPQKNSLKCGGAGSKILVTTRNEMVAIVMGTIKNEIHHLGHLSDEDCWSLFNRRALPEKSEQECKKFKNIGLRMANKCKGLPLAVKTLGSLLRFKNTLEEWENVLNSEIWELEEVEVELFPHLLLSYNELSPTLKQCFCF